LLWRTEEAVNGYGRRKITLPRLPSRCYANTTREKTTHHQCDSVAVADGIQLSACIHNLPSAIYEPKAKRL
jgi:hypothetical protein